MPYTPSSQDVTQLPSWQALREQRQALESFSLRQAFTDDPQRFARFSLDDCGLFLDYSKNLIDVRTRSLLVELAREASLAEAIDLMSAATAVVSNDSGLMHVAAALNRPLVAVYGSTSPGFTPPLADRVEIVRLGLECSPCFERTCRYGHYNCLRELKPRPVIEALDRLVGETLTLVEGD